MWRRTCRLAGQAGRRVRGGGWAGDVVGQVLCAGVPVCLCVCVRMCLCAMAFVGPQVLFAGSDVSPAGRLTLQGLGDASGCSRFIELPTGNYDALLYHLRLSVQAYRR
jgi:hypothetical protein